VTRAMVLKSHSPSSPVVARAPARCDRQGQRRGRLAARRSLLGQIARLERELVEQRCSSWPRTHLEPRAQPDRHDGCGRLAAVAGSAAHGRGARVLGIDRLEALRDELVETVSAERRALASRTLAEEESRRLREELMLDPAANAGARVRNADAGEGGCGEVRSEPVGGVLGMLMGWWRVVVSSGCP
jgi:hypothetical protein